MILIELGKKRKLAALLHLADAARRIEIRKRFGCRTESNALIKRRHESRAPVARAANHLAVIVAEHSEGRQVLILGAQAIAEPGPKRWPTAEDRTCVHLADAVGMIQTITPAGADDRKIIDAFGGVREPIRNPEAALTALLPFAAIRQKRCINLTHRGNDRAEAFRQPLSCQLAQLGLVIERVEMTWPAFHKQENHAFYFGRKVERLGSE